MTSPGTWQASPRPGTHSLDLAFDRHGLDPCRHRDEPFPRTNDRGEFRDRVSGKK